MKPSKKAINAAENSHYFWVFERQLPGAMDINWRDGLRMAIEAAYAVDMPDSKDSPSKEEATPQNLVSKDCLMR